MRVTRVLTAVVATCAMIAALAPGARADQVKLRALVLSGANNHDWRTTTPEIVDELTRTGRFSVDVTNEPGRLSLADMQSYDVLVDNYNGPRLGDEWERDFLAYVAGGGGVVIVHAADNAFDGWPQFDELIGIAWRAGAGHGTYHRYLVTIDDPEHPITRGVPHFLHAPDELYHNLRWDPNTHCKVIASAYSRPEERGTGKVEPMLLVNEWGKGRMFHTAMGHDVTSLKGAYHVLLLARGTEWAATGKVTIPVPKDLPSDSLVDVTNGGIEEIKAKWIALGLAPGPAQAIGVAGGPAERAGALTRIAAEGAPAARVTAHQQLVQLALPAATALMGLMASSDESVRWQVENDLVIVAARQNGAPESARRLVATVAPFAGSNQPQHVREAAVRMLGVSACSGATDVLAPLLGDPVVGSRVVAALRNVPGSAATRALGRYATAAPEEEKPAVLSALGVRGDSLAASKLAAFLSTGSASVAEAAAAALGGIPVRSSAYALSAALGGDAPVPVKSAAAHSLVLVGEAYATRGDSSSALAALKAVIDNPTSEADTVGALATLGLVDNAEALAILERHADDGTVKVKIASAMGLARMKSPEALAALEGLLRTGQDTLRLAIVPTVARLGTAAFTPTLLALLDDSKQTSSVRTAAASALGTLAPTEGYDAVVRAFADPDEAVRAAAFGSGTSIGRKLAAEGKAPQAVELATAIYRQSERPEDKAAALDIVASAPMAQCAVFVAAALEKAEGPTAGPAARAAVAVADLLAREGNKDRAVDLYIGALRVAPGEVNSLGIAGKLAAAGAGGDVAAIQGFLVYWHIVGPFPSPNGSGFDAAFEPESKVDLTAGALVDGRALDWKPVRIDSPLGTVDLKPLFDPSNDVCCYAYTEFDAPADMDAVLKIGSDDGVVAWLNGERVHANNAARPCVVDQDVVNAKLKQGKNTLLLKIVQGAGDWAFCVRLVDAAGRPVLGG